MPKALKLNSLLLLITVVGLILLVREQRKLKHVESERDRLGSKFGVLEIRDPSRYRVIRLQTDSEYQFSWRYYIPANLAINQQSSFGTGGGSRSISGTSQESSEHLGRCEFVFAEERVLVYITTGSGGGTMELGSKPVRDFLLQHWADLEFDILADTEAVSVDPDQIVSFLTIRVPERLHAEMVEQAGPAAKRFTSEPLFESALGTAEAFDAREEARENRTQR